MPLMPFAPPRPPTRQRAWQHALLVLVFAAGLTGGSSSALAQTAVVYPRGTDDTPGFPEQVLQMALRRSGNHYVLRLSPRPLTQGRALALLEAGKGIDVVNFMTSAEREERFLPIRFPIDKGMLGIRLLLIHRSSAERFHRITQVGELQALLAGQGSDWPDADILRQDGFSVFTTTNYAGLFKMLESKRIDYFPRSLTEVWDEAERHAGEGLIVEPTLVLRYPAASYFFVNRHNPQLAAAIGAGLDAMQADGSFDRLFLQFYGEKIRKARLGARTVFHLPNAALPAQTPLSRAELWLHE